MRSEGVRLPRYPQGCGQGRKQKREQRGVSQRVSQTATDKRFPCDTPVPFMPFDVRLVKDEVRANANWASL